MTSLTRWLGTRAAQDFGLFLAGEAVVAAILIAVGVR